MTKPIVASLIVGYLVNTVRFVNTTDAFSAVYKVSIIPLKHTCVSILTIAEAVAILLQKPAVCQHQKFVQALQLNWPPSNVITVVLHESRPNQGIPLHSNSS